MKIDEGPTPPRTRVDPVSKGETTITVTVPIGTVGEYFFNPRTADISKILSQDGCQYEIERIEHGLTRHRDWISGDFLLAISSIVRE